MGEPWLDKRGIAAHFTVSVRWIEKLMLEGMPHFHLGKGTNRRAKFHVAEVEAWLWENGYIEKRGDRGEGRDG